MRKRIIIDSTTWTIRRITKEDGKHVAEIVSLWENSTFNNHWFIKIDKQSNVYASLNDFLHTDCAKALVSEKRWGDLAEMMEVFFDTKDSGTKGKIWEIVTKLYLNGYRGNSTIVSAKGKVDVVYHGHSIEVKSNCGELNDILKSEMVIYTMDNVEDVAHPENGRVYTSVAFMEMLDKLGLIRRKVNKCSINTTIQSYRNSGRKTRLLTEEQENRPTTASWKEMV